MTGDRRNALTLALNAGSSSLKFATYENDEPGQLLVQRGAVEDVGGSAGRLWIHDHEGNALIERDVEAPDHRSALDLVLDALDADDQVAEVGHRVVRGGLGHQEPEALTDSLLSHLDAIADIDPLHSLPALAVMRGARARLADARHAACFDTAFHGSMPESASHCPLPDDLWDRGVRRYGFHGLVAESVVDQLPAAGRLVIAHLGSGVSVTAVLDGRGMDTTMGFTPAGGVMMSTRSGDLDPSILLHLIEHLDYTPDRLRTLLWQQSGLFAVSGTTGNMRELLMAMPGDERATLAVEMFCHQVTKAIGSMASVLDGIDTLVFSGGIGERSPVIRSMISKQLGYCGVYLDEGRNVENAPVISPYYHQVEVRVLGADEERLIARHTHEVVTATRSADS